MCGLLWLLVGERSWRLGRNEIPARHLLGPQPQGGYAVGVPLSLRSHNGGVPHWNKGLRMNVYRMFYGGAWNYDSASVTHSGSGFNVPVACSTNSSFRCCR